MVGSIALAMPVPATAMTKASIRDSRTLIA